MDNPQGGPTISFAGLPVRTLTGRIKIHPVGYGFVVDGTMLVVTDDGKLTAFR